MKLYLTRLTLPDQPSERRRIQSEGGYRLLSVALAKAGIDPSGLRLCRTPEGKPYLRYADGSVADFAFSISHSGCWAVCALSEEARSPIGVDLERIRAVSPAVWMRYLAVAPHEAVGDAYTAILRWTRYEAVFKQTGSGTPAALAGDGSLTLRPIPGYVLTVAGEERLSSLRFVGEGERLAATPIEW